MSLTFDFPQWKLRVASGRQGRVDEGSVDRDGSDNRDWAADLDELESEDDGPGDEAAKSGLAVQGVDRSPRVHEIASEAGGPGHPSPRFAVPEAIGSSRSQPKEAKEESLDLQPAGTTPTTTLSTPGAERGAAVPLRAASAVPTRPADPAARPAPAAVVRGDSIPSEVLLLVLSELRDDVGDCVRAALVCTHWMAVVAQSNELWFELHTRHLGGGTWRRPPYAGRPLVNLPPGGDHGRSKILSYKTTCALTQVALRFMVLRKGFEYVVEAAASLWLAARRAAADRAVGGPPGPTRRDPAGSPCPQAGPVPSPRVAAGARGGTGEGEGGASGNGGGGGEADPAGTGDVEQAAGLQKATAARTSATPPSPGLPDGSADSDVGGGGGAEVACGIGGVWAAAGGGAAGGGSCGGGHAGRSGKKRRITHVDQLWESCGRSKAALQVDERFNAVRVQQMVGKLVSAGAGAGQWLALYEGVAAVMASRCDELRDELGNEAAAARTAAARDGVTTSDVPVGGPEETDLTERSAAAGGSSGTVVGGDSIRMSEGPMERGGGCPGGLKRGGGARRPLGLQFRGEVVYGGDSYADQFAELLRRGDTRGALALGASRRAGLRGGSGSGAAAEINGSRYGGGGDGGDGGGDDKMDGELDEPEMREVVAADFLEYHDFIDSADLEAIGAGAYMSSAAPAIVREGLLLWRRLLPLWSVYRRWLEVLVVWCGPLGARVEAERQLAGAASAHGEAPLAPPHLTNKGLLLFRSQVLLAYPLRRPLQAAALWLSARAEQAYGDDGLCGAAGEGAAFGLSPSAAGSGPGGGRNRGWAAPRGGAGGGAGCGPALSEEHSQLLTGIRKALTELAVPDDPTQPAHQHTRQKLQRCFGRLLLRSVPGGTRSLMRAQRLSKAPWGGVGNGRGRGGGGSSGAGFD